MRKFAILLYRWLYPLVDPIRLAVGLPNYAGYFRDWYRYSRSKSAEPIGIFDTYPCLHDKTISTGLDRHYFYQGVWAFERIRESGPEHHVDVGSRLDFVGYLTAITRVTFIDIRPVPVMLERLEVRQQNILAMPFGDASVPSLSCLHVAEHIGLGRYGDPIDPLGTRKACKELSRVLAPDGNLYFSLPVGKPRLCFNAHRVHSARQIFDYFCDLKLVELSGIDDKGMFVRNIDPGTLDKSDYACGLFWFTKR